MMNGFEINYEEMKEKGVYDYVSQHYWEMSKEQLANICKELSYAVHECLDNKISKGKMLEEIEESMIEELKELNV